MSPGFSTAPLHPTVPHSAPGKQRVPVKFGVRYNSFESMAEDMVRPDDATSRPSDSACAQIDEPSTLDSMFPSSRSDEGPVAEPNVEGLQQHALDVPAAAACARTPPIPRRYNSSTRFDKALLTPLTPSEAN